MRIKKNINQDNFFIFSDQCKTKFSGLKLYEIYTEHVDFGSKGVNSLYPLTSVFIFSILFSIHFVKCRQGEFV